ncbi:Bug family tripartite tricarboxylate transporter substrate binding protein [Paenacidovorax monticola]|uniref:Tripartite tricarboxylate transporter substrate binding protein n=1 Tax=Paenacidovorax monticola TaxID=1926868 RepID=A0A7H0HEC3_9BURK|nr:tripartite tricarboxylate transporter substrate-binding protein [Paenacidovorax monticola]QNP58889.1 tripartite tricarboxylate transporter substrate binding protein [Paenacidovorax monticola]
MHRKQFLAALALGALAPTAFAQDPKPLEWVVGYAAGGGSDIVARAIAESMGAALGRTIIINNKPGAGTNIAAEYTARSRDFGNIMFTADFATIAANPSLFSKLSYNAERDFQPVGLLVRFPMFLVVSNQVPANNYKEFAAWARKQADGVNWASAGPGSPHHLVGELFREHSGLKLTHVPYRGAAPAIQDVVGGQVSAMWVDSASVYPFLAARKVKAIGVASPQRVATAPDVPTLQEQGLAGFEGYAWQGIVVPTGTSSEVVGKFSGALQTALADTRTRARLQALGVEPMPGTPAQMASFSKSEREKWGAVIAKVGVKLD